MRPPPAHAGARRAGTGSRACAKRARGAVALYGGLAWPARAGCLSPPLTRPTCWSARLLPGNYGFDPLNLGKDAGALARFQEAEVIHGRWAMLGVAGALAVEVLGFGNWYDAPLWVSGPPGSPGAGLGGSGWAGRRGFGQPSWRRPAPRTAGEGTLPQGPTLPRPPALQAINGGNASYFGIEVPFDLNTLLGIVSRRLPPG
jgi:hypothetical protein